MLGRPKGEGNHLVEEAVEEEKKTSWTETVHWAGRDQRDTAESGEEKMEDLGVRHQWHLLPHWSPHLCPPHGHYGQYGARYAFTHHY